MGNLCELSHGFEIEPSKLSKNKKDSISTSSSIKTDTHKQFRNIIQDYDFFKCIGEGKFGMVFLVEHKKFKLKCAIKIIKKIKSNHIIKNFESFKTEKNLLKKMDHPNIIKLYDSFESSSHYFLVLEYAKNNDLRRFISKTKNLSLDHIQFLASHILNALIYLHQEFNIIYRDLKPENILLGKKGIPKICDFGISKSTEITETVCGTPIYMSPEIFQSNFKKKVLIRRV